MKDGLAPCGMQTFSQLVTFDFNKGEYHLKGAPWSITDAPRFPHRGLLMVRPRQRLMTGGNA
jgi:hexosaminidase